MRQYFNCELTAAEQWIYYTLEKEKLVFTYSFKYRIQLVRLVYSERRDKQGK